MTRTKLYAKRMWQQADAVCFDVDSTLITEEGIDGLAEFCGAGVQVREWTKKAMGGAVPFQVALRSRLEIINPTLQQMLQFRDSKKPAEMFTPGIRQLVALLQRSGTTVYLVSGGFRRFIEPLAKLLDIPRENVHANRLLFTEKGEYDGFDRTELTCESDGKTRVLELLKKKHNKIVMIGDGMTDMAASPPADAFIGFGGNVVREKVEANAAWYVYHMQELIDELEQSPKCNLALEHSPKGKLVLEQSPKGNIAVEGEVVSEKSNIFSYDAGRLDVPPSSVLSTSPPLAAN